MKGFGYSSTDNEIVMHRLTTGAEYVTSFGSFARDAAPQIYPSVERTDFEAFKPGHAVGFGPQANFAGGPRKSPVGRDKKLPAIEKYREAFVSRRDAKSVPCLARHIDLHTSDHLSLSGDDTIKANVIFERAGAGDVIIINRCKSDEYASGLDRFRRKSS